MPSPFDASVLDLPGSILLDDRCGPCCDGCTFVLRDPIAEIVARRPEEVPPALAAIDRHTAAGRYVAGYIGYEAGAALDRPIAPRPTHAIPLLWLGVYRDLEEHRASEVAPGTPDPPERLLGARLNIPAAEYLEHVRAIQEYIAAGDVYQVNFTCKLRFRNAGTPRGLFARLREAHPVGHSAYVNLGATQIVSLSPELFLRREGDDLLTRPMKGTMRRGRWSAEDAGIAAALAAHEKNRAENVMIVDLMRNDIGRISTLGGVSAPRLFHVERYGTLFQMTSDVRGRLAPSVTTADIVRATFPPGSITGAPKIRAMEIIRETEAEARGPYCGAIGLFRPGGDLLLNVAIRTIVQTGQECEMGIGGGIVADSDPRDELREALLKGTFRRARRIPFDILETLAYRSATGFAYRGEHLARMERSAERFGRAFDAAGAESALCEAAAAIDAEGIPAARVRLLLAADRSVRTEWRPLGDPPTGPVDVLLTVRRATPADPYLFHKTTHRAEHDDAYARAQRHGCFDALFVGAGGAVCEGAITNLVAEVDGRCVTPPLECGLLPGLWRQGMLDRGEAVEARIPLDDLLRAVRVWIGNSVRGAVEVGRVLRAGADGAVEVVWSRPGGG